MPDKCPAKSAICHRCGKKGHFEAQCFSKTTTNKLSLETAFLDAVTVPNKEIAQTATLLLNNHKVC